MNHFIRMFGNRVPHMLESDYKPYSAIDIFVKDLVRIIMSLNFEYLFELPRIDRITSQNLILTLAFRELFVMKAPRWKYRCMFLALLINCLSQVLLFNCIHQTSMVLPHCHSFFLFSIFSVLWIYRSLFKLMSTIGYIGFSLIMSYW